MSNQTRPISKEFSSLMGGFHSLCDCSCYKWYEDL